MKPSRPNLLSVAVAAAVAGSIAFAVGCSTGAGEREGAAASAADSAAVVAAAPDGAPSSASADAVAPTSGSADEIVVYRSESCGCCKAWEEHLRESGFTVVDRVTEDLTEVKATFQVPGQLQSCHTATIGGYVVEGHVPADLIRKMLAEKPQVAGIAVPGMPMGSPGMEQGGAKDPYDVLLFEKTGSTRVYARR
jgi:hypothetical protein